MTIIGFNISKLQAEHKSAQKKGNKINMSIKIDDVAKTNLSFDNDRGALKTHFVYTVTYAEFGEIVIEGELLSMLENKEVESLIKSWKETKSLPESMSKDVISHIMNRCTIQAVILSKDIGLPPPIPMPQFKQPEQESTPEKKPTARLAKSSK